MTDEQIIKACECCEVGKDKCKKCPLYCNVPACSRYLAQFALDLIKRQQAEIERLKEANNELKHETSYMSNPYTIGDRHEMGG